MENRFTYINTKKGGFCVAWIWIVMVWFAPLSNGFVASNSKIFQIFPIHWSHFRVTASVIILPPSLFAWPHQVEWSNTPQILMYLDTCDLKLHLREGIVSILHYNKNIRCQLLSCVFKSFSKKASSNSKVRSCKKVSAVYNAVPFGMIKKGTGFLHT